MGGHHHTPTEEEDQRKKHTDRKLEIRTNRLALGNRNSPGSTNAHVDSDGLRTGSESRLAEWACCNGCLETRVVKESPMKLRRIRRVCVSTQYSVLSNPH